MYKKIDPIPNMTNAFDVKDKNVVVTGGNRGIGKGIATAFAQSGANVIILCRNQESGQEVVDSFAQYGGTYACFQCDISDIDSAEAAAAKVYEMFDHVDTLVNNAGVATKTPFLAPDKAGLKEWHRVINTNLHGPANMIYSIVPKMIEADLGGNVINISSTGGQRVSNAKSHPNAPYNASKAALDMFTKHLAAVLGDNRIRVMSIAPGPTHSDLDKDLPPEFLQMVEDKLPAHRFGEAIEIGALCVFLSSPAGVQLTGSIINHDGGIIVAG